ncbi:nuclear transport factor 2 family protein [Limosilactobacillus albertensis]|uniref:Nuclear transport factor 2 family protein n=1 Tax=Limosilactobacillus albertensis TaxID=2759752 RepID=A0A839HAP0_9LACO|nr:nuclear transport factor 2 family protein [Limosilactobacillus albertensis]MBB1124167.1 nuclear transport factor 2 family protein [Limosilactobacillus albertensis]MCD7122043.1 nuclear transport factor 2 family protein [Limosilactobacillus albertensis]
MTDRETIIDLYRQENRAMVAKDIETLSQILASTMVLHHMTGYAQPKLEWIDQIQNGELKYYSSDEEGISDIRIDGNYASLIGHNQVKASVWGSSVNTWQLQMKMEFAKVNGKWTITNQVASTY